MISIAMTTYNGERYLREQLDSILNQTYKNFELIVCDDFSSDNTKTILQEYKRKDDRIKLFFNDTNLGFKKNFEQAINFCSYDLIALSDQDDIWEPNHLELLNNLIKNADIACANAKLIDSNGINMNIYLNESDGLLCFDNSDDLLYRLLANFGGFQGASMLLKKDLLIHALPIPENVLYHDSWFVSCSCFLNKINYSFDIITKYRQHQNQITLHEKQSYLIKIKNFIKRLQKKEKYFTDRFAYIEELSKRFKLTENQKNILNNCYKIQLMKAKKINLFQRIKVNIIYIKNYKKIYTQTNYKFCIFRSLKNIF